MVYIFQTPILFNSEKVHLAVKLKGRQVFDIIWASNELMRETKGAFQLSELTGQTIPVLMKISLLIKTIRPDQSDLK